MGSKVLTLTVSSNVRSMVFDVKLSENDNNIGPRESSTCSTTIKRSTNAAFGLPAVSLIAPSYTSR